MLDKYGLHELVWDACDERFDGILVASPADAGGRGISLAVRQDGAAASAANTAAENANEVAAAIRAAADAGDFDGAGGRIRNNLHAAIAAGALGRCSVIDLSSYATKGYVDNAVPTIQATSPLSYSNGSLSIDLSSYATRQYVDNSIPSLSGYATQDWVTQQIDAAIADLVNLEEEEF